MLKIKNISSEETLVIRQKVLWPDEILDYVRIDNDNEGNHYGLYIDEVLVSVISVFIEGEQARFRKFATLNDYQNKGYGSILFQHMLNETFKYGVNRIWCDARLDATSFYSKFNFNSFSGDIFYKGTIPYIVMEKFI
jgi:N-acetylglutamate synthase-like GNAT family acetyltransferase